MDKPTLDIIGQGRRPSDFIPVAYLKDNSLESETFIQRLQWELDDYFIMDDMVLWVMKGSVRDARAILKQYPYYVKYDLYNMTLADAS